MLTGIWNFSFGISLFYFLIINIITFFFYSISRGSIICPAFCFPYLVLHLAQATARHRSNPEYGQYITEQNTKQQSYKEDLDNVLEHRAKVENQGFPSVNENIICI